MIQRIQTVFLFLAGVASLGVFGLPFASTDNSVANSIFDDKLFNAQDHISMVVLFAVAGALALAGIFLFKNRLLQMRITLFAIIATVGGTVLALVFFSQAGIQTAEAGIGSFFPLLALIAGLLAYRFIKKDEKLVKSMDRLR